MRIGIDNISPGLSTSRNTLGGMRHFMQSLISGLPAVGALHQSELFSPMWLDPFDLPHAPNLGVVYCSNVPRNQVGRVIYEQFYLPRQICQHNVSLWLATCNTLPLRWQGPSVLIVQSLQYFTHPKAYAWPRRMYLRIAATASLRRADQLVTFSESAKKEIIQRLGVAPNKVNVIYHALRFSNTAGANYDEQREKERVQHLLGCEDYILSVSGFYPYKNLPRLIEAFAHLKPDYPHKLVFIGAETSSVKQADLRALARRLGIEQEVIFLGRVPDDQLPMFYRRATLMAMPSLDETFGLPVLEAMAFGCPVVTSSLSSMQEITGGAAVLVDPYCVASLVEGVRQIISSPELRTQKAEAGRLRAQEFTYERFFDRLMNVIEIAASSSS